MPNFKYWIDYLKETHNSELVELPEGFATFCLLEPTKPWETLNIYLKELYVAPEHRKSGIASKLVDMVAEEGRKRHCFRLIGSCAPSNSGSTESLKAILAYGMQLSHVENGVIYVYKDLK